MGKHHDIYLRQQVVVTTLNNDSLSGTVTYTDRHEITLEHVELLTNKDPVPLAGVINIQVPAIAWIQVHHQRKE
ncbi:hypothetical protein [Kocuria sp. TGY1127_2]|uniref:hypothetical protein n=1 Tax=Kocuria sp. TGY1127_2 TaxID=2711328 RepID=UPI0015C142DB|nr:hypothetical protein [Kocuria sp. TGY1127_2]